jgi:hypothetical protein
MNTENKTSKKLHIGFFDFIIWGTMIFFIFIMLNIILLSSGKMLF